MTTNVSRRAVMASLAGAALAPALAPALPVRKLLWTTPTLGSLVAPVTGIYEVSCRFVRAGMPDHVLVETYPMNAGDHVEAVMEDEGIAFVESAAKIGGGDG